MTNFGIRSVLSIFIPRVKFSFSHSKVLGYAICLRLVRELRCNWHKTAHTLMEKQYLLVCVDLRYTTKHHKTNIVHVSGAREMPGVMGHRQVDKRRNIKTPEHRNQDVVDEPIQHEDKRHQHRSRDNHREHRNPFYYAGDVIWSHSSAVKPAASSGE